MNELYAEDLKQMPVDLGVQSCRKKRQVYYIVKFHRTVVFITMWEERIVIRMADFTTQKIIVLEEPSGPFWLPHVLGYWTQPPLQEREERNKGFFEK